MKGWEDTGGRRGERGGVSGGGAPSLGVALGLELRKRPAAGP